MMRNFGQAWRACWPEIDTKDDPDVPITDFDAPHEGTDEVAPGGPIGRIQAFTNQTREGLQLADDEVE